MDGTEDGWTGAAARFFAAHLPPGEGPEEGWAHKAVSACEMATEALAALGAAEARPWGAARLDPPVPPARPPRRDDVCVAVLRLAIQQRLLEWRQADGSPRKPRKAAGGFVVTPASPSSPPPRPNILPARGLGPARAAPEAVAVMAALGLLSRDGRWTAAAEPILWRVGGPGWLRDPEADPRFARALGTALESMPAEIAADIAAKTTVPDAEVAAAMRRAEETLQRLPEAARARAAAAPTAEVARARLLALRTNDLDWIFFRRWRLADGWLTGAEAARALGIFHDSLAQAMRRAVMARLRPDLPRLAR